MLHLPEAENLWLVYEHDVVVGSHHVEKLLLGGGVGCEGYGCWHYDS